MTQNDPKRSKELNKLTKAVRRRKIIQLKAKGYTIEEIAKELGVGEKTVDRDLKSPDVQGFLDELVRRQIVDIEDAKLPMRLHFRADLIDKLSPKKPAVAIENNVKVENEVPANVNLQDLREYNRIIQELAEAEGGEAAEAVQRNSDAKPVSDAQASDSEGAQSSN